MVAAIDLDDEAELGASEVDDVRAGDELTTEGKPGFGAAETAPEALLGARGREAHGASALFEKAARAGETSERANMSTSERRARMRAERSVNAQVPCRAL